MRIGFCANMMATDPEGIGDNAIALLARLGYNYVELPLAQLMSLSQAEFESRIIRRLEDAGLPCEACNNFFPANYRLTGPNARHEEALRYADQALKRAERMGARCVVFGSGGARNTPLGFDPKQGFEQLTDFLGRLCALAEDRGIRIAIEPLNRSESNLINRLDDCVALASAANHERIGVLADIYHMLLGYEPLRNLQAARGRLYHVHIARTLGRHMPCEGDNEPYDELFSELRAIGYDGRISVEALVRKDAEAEAREALRLLRGHTTQGGER